MSWADLIGYALGLVLLLVALAAVCAAYFALTLAACWCAVELVELL